MAGGARQGFWPTHSSSTCFIRRDTLPASLVTRVLHRGAQQKHARISGLIHGGGGSSSDGGRDGGHFKGEVTESFESSWKQARPGVKSQ